VRVETTGTGEVWIVAFDGASARVTINAAGERICVAAIGGSTIDVPSQRQEEEEECAFSVMPPKVDRRAGRTLASPHWITACASDGSMVHVGDPVGTGEDPFPNILRLILAMCSGSGLAAALWMQREAQVLMAPKETE